MAVSKEIKETITETIDEVFEKMNHISWIDRQRIMKREIFNNTEKLLYAINALKEHLESEEEYFQMALKNKSCSVVRYSKNKTEKNEEQIIKDRKDSYNRSKSDYEKVMKALEHVKNKNEKSYAIIEMRYLTCKEDGSTYTWNEIASKLAGTHGFSKDLTDKTVRSRRNKAVEEIAVLIFGTDAL